MLENHTIPILLEDLGMIYRTENSKQKSHMALFRCSFCRKEFKARIADVKNGNTSSCGCHRNGIHNMSNSKLFYVWQSMIKRCHDKKNKSFFLYGERGIRVCDEWKNDFRNFHSWSISNGYANGLSIDRINNDGNYEPENCRWTNSETQARNTRIIRKSNSSGYKGVSYKKENKKFISQICVSNKRIHIGIFKTAKEAAVAYNNYVFENALEHTINKI